MMFINGRIRRLLAACVVGCGLFAAAPALGAACTTAQTLSNTSGAWTGASSFATSWDGSANCTTKYAVWIDVVSTASDPRPADQVPTATQATNGIGGSVPFPRLVSSNSDGSGTFVFGGASSAPWFWDVRVRVCDAGPTATTAACLDGVTATNIDLPTDYRPSGPGYLRATRLSGGRVHLEWEAQADATWSGFVVSYAMEWKKASDADWPIDGRGPGAAVGVGVGTSLTAGPGGNFPRWAAPFDDSEGYQFGVYTSFVGEHANPLPWRWLGDRDVGSDTTDTAVPAVPTVANPQPDNPASVTGTRTDGTVTVTWTPAAYAGTTATMRYDVNYSVDAARSWRRAGSAVTHVGSNKTDAQSYTIRNLPNDGRAIASVRTLADLGVDGMLESGWTNSNFMEALAGVPGPVTFTGTPSRTCSNVTGAANVAWNAVNGATGYNVNWRYDNGGWQRFASNQSATTTCVTDATDGLRSVIVGVQALNSTGAGEWRNTPWIGPATTLPGQVQGFGASVVGTSLLLAWTAPTEGGSLLYSYDINYNRNGGGWVRLASNVSASTYNVQSVVAGQSGSVIFAIRASNSAGSGPWINWTYDIP